MTHQGNPCWSDWSIEFPVAMLRTLGRAEVWEKGEQETERYGNGWTSMTKQSEATNGYAKTERKEKER